jgi:hypothetical protein
MPRGRKAKNKRRSPKFKGVNLVNAAEGYVQTSIWTNALFKTNPISFLTGMTKRSSGALTYAPGADGGSVITVPELLGAGPGGIGGNYGNYADNFIGAVSRNLSGKSDGTFIDATVGLIQPAIASTLVGVGFKVGKELTKKPRRMFNKMSKNLGLGSMVRA